MAVRTKVLIGVSCVAGGLLGYLLYRRLTARPWVNVGRVAELHIHPVKSGATNKVQRARATIWGLADDDGCHDRHMMVISSKTSRFVTARQTAALVLLRSRREGDTMVMECGEGEPLLIDLAEVKRISHRRMVGLWPYADKPTLHIEAFDCGDMASLWLIDNVVGLSEVCPDGVRLVFHDPYEGNLSNERTVDRFPPIKRKEKAVFADLTSYMLMSLPSLRHLNSRLAVEERVPCEQFRPNIVIDGPFEEYHEDKCKRLRIGRTTFSNIKPCTRCPLTTINVETGERAASGQPLKELKTYRLVKDKVWAKISGQSPQMGVNLLVDEGEGGEICVGDTVFVQY